MLLEVHWKKNLLKNSRLLRLKLPSIRQAQNPRLRLRRENIKGFLVVVHVFEAADC